jgi:hypothetical protein
MRCHVGNLHGPLRSKESESVVRLSLVFVRPLTFPRNHQTPGWLKGGCRLTACKTTTARSLAMNLANKRVQSESENDAKRIDALVARHIALAVEMPQIDASFSTGVEKLRRLNESSEGILEESGSFRRRT